MACSRPSRYRSTRFFNSACPARLKQSTPNPISPAFLKLSGWLQATHRGGWGDWTGLGITERGGMVKNCPSWEKGSSVHILGIIEMASSHWALVSSGLTSKPSISISVVDRPVPRSTLPLLRMSSTAARSATRTGWLY